MENSKGVGEEKLIKILDKTAEKGTWARIVLSSMFLNAMPDPLKKRFYGLPRHSQDRRWGKRFHIDKTVTCIRDKDYFEPAHLIDISVHGMYVEMDKTPDLGQEMYFNLSGINMGPIMRIKGRVTRRTDKGMAVQFT